MFLTKWFIVLFRFGTGVSYAICGNCPADREARLKAIRITRALPTAASYAIIDVCLQQRGSNRCRLVLVWGVERIFGDAGISGLA